MIDLTKKVLGMFDDLILRGEQIKDACKKTYFAGVKKGVDSQFFEAWRMSCLTLLRSTFGSSSPHCDSFATLRHFDHYNSTMIYLGILQSAREDIRKGYFYHKDLMLSVNVFNAFLSRAGAFAEKGEDRKAAGLLEAVASESLRKLAEAKGIALDKDRGIPDAADTLLSAGAISVEKRDKFKELKGFVDRFGTAMTDALDNRGNARGWKRPEHRAELKRAEHRGAREQTKANESAPGARGVESDGESAIEETASEGDGFLAWCAWVQKFLYEYLGSLIVILN